MINGVVGLQTHDPQAELTLPVGYFIVVNTDSSVISRIEIVGAAPTQAVNNRQPLRYPSRRAQAPALPALHCSTGTEANLRRTT